MKKKLIIMVLAIMAAGWAGQAWAEPQVRISTSGWNYGTVNEGEKLYYDIEFSNAGSSEMAVRSRVDCECLSITPETIKISSNKSSKFKVKFVTKGYTGKIDKYLYFQTNDPAHSAIILPVTGNILPAGLQPVENKKPEPESVKSMLVVKIVSALIFVFLIILILVKIKHGKSAAD